MTEDKSKQLLPCPFCGGTNVWLRDYDPSEIWIECDDCQIGTLPTLTWPECLIRWNTRPKADNPK